MRLEPDPNFALLRASGRGDLKWLTNRRSRGLPLEPAGRHCAICNKPGGSGFTTALRLAGVEIPEGQIGYAHADCLHKIRHPEKN